MALGSTGLLRQDITIRRTSTDDGEVDRDEYGEPKHEPEETVKGRYQPSTRTNVVTTFDGVERVVRGVIYLDADVEISVHDEVTIPGGDSPPIIRIDEAIDGAGKTFYKKVFVG